MKNIYILTDKKVLGAINLPLLEIEYIDCKIDFDNYDGIIITSKNAIYSLEKFNQNWQQTPAYAIAPLTAKVIKEHNGTLAYIGKYKHGNEFANELIPILKNKKVLYLRGSKVVSNLVKILNDNDVICDEQIIYQSGCKKEVSTQTLPKNSIMIFSSPSTIECFFKHFSWDESYKAISIGKTTASYFPNYITPIISDDTSLKACVQKAKKIKFN